MNHLLSTQQFTERKMLEEIFASAEELERAEKEKTLEPYCAGKILATVFYEPSTRTRFSFEAAMHRLGGDVLSAENAAGSSSAFKGESLEDAMRVVSGYADAIVLRHPESGSAERASRASLVPVINAGDGSGEHPTQALLDLFTIRKELGRIDDLTIAFVGDLRMSRTVHSLLYLLPLCRNIRLFLVSPKTLALSPEYKGFLVQRGIPHEEADLAVAVPQADVLSVTRIQKERFTNPAEYRAVEGSYVIDRRVLEQLKKQAIIMHPLPRVNEIAKEVDQDVRAAYFRQTKNGVAIRMALLKRILT